MQDPNTCGVNLTEHELFMSSIGIGADGLPFQRLVIVAETGDDFITCGQDPSTFSEKQLYGLDSNGKIARRVSIDGL